jgi:hypothetical protein
MLVNLTIFVILAKKGTLAKAPFSTFAMRQGVDGNAHNFRISAISYRLLPDSP